MTKKKEIKLGVFLAGTGHHVASWRHPQAPADASMNLDYFKELAKTAERGSGHAVFGGQFINRRQITSECADAL